MSRDVVPLDAKERKMPLRNLLVPTDLSDVARRVYPCAANLSERFDAAIHLVHFSSPQNWGMPGLSREEPSRLDDVLRQEARQHSLTRAKVASSEVIHERIREALPRIIRERRIDLTVIAKHGWSGALRFVVPSFSERIVRLANIPVLVIDPRTQKPVPPHRMTVLVPFDFTAAANSVLPAIQFLHAHFDIQFHFLYVSGSPKGRMQFFQALWLANGAEETIIEEDFAALQQEQLRGVEAKLETRPGAPLQEILRRADEMHPDLIIVSTSGLLGNVAQSVVRHSDHCVLTWPAKRIHHDDALDAPAYRSFRGADRVDVDAIDAI
jgi:nucleotide-binding universal stress UspA family protein